MNEKIITFLRTSAGYITSAVFTATYIALSVLTIERTGRSLPEIIGAGFLYYIFQISLISLLRPQGLINGKNSKEYQETRELHGQKVEEISEDMNLLPLWCKRKNAENYREQRIKILAREGLKYSDYFDKDGNVIKIYELDAKKMSLRWSNRFIRRHEKKKFKACKKAFSIRLSELDATAITSSDKSKADKYALPEDEKEYLGRKLIKDLVLKALPSVLFGLYGAKELAALNWAAFAWTVFQAATAFASAVAEMIGSHNYIVNDVRTGMVKKIGWMDDFITDLKANPDRYKIEDIDEWAHKCNNAKKDTVTE